MAWRVGNGTSVNFWQDVWFPSLGPLVNHVQWVVPYHLMGIRVGDLVNHMGDWEWLPIHARYSILGHIPPIPSASSDTVAWRTSL